MASENGKFKVGDRVVATSGGYGAKVGQTYEVTKVEPFMGDYWVWVDGLKGDSTDGSLPERDFVLAAPVPAWRPKVGDRVLSLVDWCDVKKGETYAVEAVNKEGIWVGVPDSMNHYMSNDEIEPAPAAASPVTLTIEAGKFYKTRDGRKVGPIRAVTKNMIGTYRFRGVENVPNGRDLFIPASGEGVNHGFGYDTNLDLVALWGDPDTSKPASNDNAAVAKPKFKVGDRVVVTGNRPGLVPKIGKYGVVSSHKWEGYMVKLNDGGEFAFVDEELTPAAPPTTPAIVALIENGEPRPSTAPKVHTSQASATTEAERLALEHPGQQFGVFVLADSKIADLVTTQTAVLRAA